MSTGPNKPTGIDKARGLKEIPRAKVPKRPVDERVRDWHEVEGSRNPAELRLQASRCMDCGVPFCHKGCPLGNYIPDWNHLVHEGDWRAAAARLHDTNNFPEFTGRTCPAPCEQSCVLNINTDAVTIKQIERHIIDRAWEQGWVEPRPAQRKTGHKVAVVGSGPAGLAAAQQLARAGHEVTVFERDDRVGGLLRYGIPGFKMAKEHIDLRVRQMEAEGVSFVTGVALGSDRSLQELRAEFEVVLLAVGAKKARELPIPGRELEGIYPAMDYLVRQNHLNAGDEVADPIDAGGRRVLILGGGDTGADCLGTAHRQEAAEVRQFEILPKPPEVRDEDRPWPWWPMVLRTSSAHEEGGVRDWSVLTKRFVGDSQGRVQRLELVRVQWVDGENGRKQMHEIPGSAFELEADLVLLAIGFTGVTDEWTDDRSGVSITRRGTIEVDEDYQTSIPGVYACGDATRGASLVVWGIWEGREAARCIDLALTGNSRLRTLPNPRPL